VAWLGKVEPDAVAWLAVTAGRGERVLKLLIELDYGTEGPRRLGRKLRHYVGWAEHAGREHWVVFVVPDVEREARVHAAVRQVAPDYGDATVPLLTTTAALLAGPGVLGAIWWDGVTRYRIGLLEAKHPRAHW
jgi:hypothetical protein